MIGPSEQRGEDPRNASGGGGKKKEKETENRDLAVERLELLDP